MPTNVTWADGQAKLPQASTAVPVALAYADGQVGALPIAYVADESVACTPDAGIVQVTGLALTLTWNYILAPGVGSVMFAGYAPEAIPGVPQVVPARIVIAPVGFA